MLVCPALQWGPQRPTIQPESHRDDARTFRPENNRTQNGLRSMRRPFVPAIAGAAYFKLPLESIVMPPGPAFFFSSFALRVPSALVVKSFAEAISDATALGLP